MKHVAKRQPRNKGSVGESNRRPSHLGGVRVYPDENHQRLSLDSPRPGSTALFPASAVTAERPRLGARLGDRHHRPHGGHLTGAAKAAGCPTPFTALPPGSRCWRPCLLEGRTFSHSQASLSEARLGRTLPPSGPLMASGPLFFL